MSVRVPALEIAYDNKVRQTQRMGERIAELETLLEKLADIVGAPMGDEWKIEKITRLLEKHI